MSKIIFYRSGVLTAAQAAFVEDNSAEVRDVFSLSDEEKDHQHIFAKQEVPGFSDCVNPSMFLELSADKPEETEPTPAPESAKKKKSKKVNKKV